MKSFQLNKQKFLFCIFFLFSFFLIVPSAVSETKLNPKLVEIETREGISLKFILIKPENPVASVILFAGGKGQLDLYSTFGKPYVKKGKNIFVVRTRKEFAEQKLMVALVDMPSDFKKKAGKVSWWPDWPEKKVQFRMCEDHGKDISAVAKYLKKISNIPVWIVGTSWGTVSATNGAIRSADVIDGLVLTSSMTRTREKWRMRKTHPNCILDMELDKIAVPSLLVAHNDDKCEVTPAEDVKKILKGLKNSKNVKAIYFDGGKKTHPESKECWGRSAHGFYGIEKKVVTAIADFIKSELKK